jgi:hypothetical protein
MTDFHRIAHGELDEGETALMRAKTNRRRREAAQEKRQAALKAEAARIVRGEYRKAGPIGPITKAFAEHRRTLQTQRRPNEAEAMQQRFADQQRRQKLAAIRARVDERFINFRKGFDE